MDITALNEAKKTLIDQGRNLSQLADAVGINRNYLRWILQGREPGRKYRGAIMRELKWKSWPMAKRTSKSRAVASTGKTKAGRDVNYLDG